MKIILIIATMFSLSQNANADTFTKQDQARWQKEFDASAKYGRELWVNSAKVKLGSNGVSCAQCHPNGANTHYETYPKFQKQLGKVAAMWEMVNWCIKNPLEGKPLAADSKEMIAIQAYVASERSDVKIQPGKH